MNTCVTPLDVSNVSSELRSPHGVPEVVVIEITPTTSARVALDDSFANGKLAENTSPLAMVKLAALPTAPLGPTNEMLPLQDAAVPLDDALALLSTLICRVSLLASPTGGKSNVRVFELDDVCATAADAANNATALRARIHLSKIILFSPRLKRALIIERSAYSLLVT